MTDKNVAERDAPMTDDELQASLELAEQLPDDGDTTAPAAPRRARTRKPRAAKPRAKAGGDKGPAKPRAPRQTPLGKRVEAMHTTVALGLSLAPAPWAQPTAMSLATQAADIGKAWEQLAKDNPRVAEALERILTVSTLGALVGAYVPVVIAGLAASGKLPGQLGGMTTPADPMPDAATTEAARPFSVV
jgi:hypothetical protein